MDARVESVVLVSTGVECMCGLIKVWAARTESRVNGNSIVDIVNRLVYRVRVVAVQCSVVSWWARWCTYTRYSGEKGGGHCGVVKAE